MTDEYDPCKCGEIAWNISATMIACKSCGRLWGRCNGRWVLDPDSEPSAPPADVQPPPVLDLDALEAHARIPCADSLALPRGDALCLIAEARAAVALRAELTAQARKNREALRDLAAAQRKCAEAKRLASLALVRFDHDPWCALADEAEDTKCNCGAAPIAAALEAL